VAALEQTRVTPLMLDLDGVLGDTRRLWDDWLADASRVLGVDPAALPEDRGDAAATLDDGAGNWRALLGRYAAERAPVYLRPDAAVSAALRGLSASGVRLGVFTDAPAELAEVAVAQLGAARRVEAVESGAGSVDRLRARLGVDAQLVTTRARLLETTRGI
jgi:phosphoglycolate phosphatase-like HAD superfamily hydrolase